jgi:hypothetical protein
MPDVEWEGYVPSFKLNSQVLDGERGIEDGSADCA